MPSSFGAVVTPTQEGGGGGGRAVMGAAVGIANNGAPNPKPIPIPRPAKGHGTPKGGPVKLA